MWRDSDDGMRPYIYNSGWVEDMTIIKGGNILTRTIVATAISTRTLLASNISTGTLTGDEISATAQIVAGTGNNVGVLSGSDATYRIWAGHATAGSAPFKVTQAGLVGASAGNIAGWTISAASLSSNSATLAAAGYLTLGTGDNLVKLDATDSVYRIWVGDAIPADAPFSVEKDGTMHANIGTFAGDLTGANMDLSGSLDVSGSISVADIVIDSNGITSTTTQEGRSTNLFNGRLVVSSATLEAQTIYDAALIQTVYTAGAANHSLTMSAALPRIALGDGTYTTLIYGNVTTSQIGSHLDVQGNLYHSGSNAGFYSKAPIAKQTGVAVTAAGIHAALTNLGLIS